MQLMLSVSFLSVTAQGLRSKVTGIVVGVRFVTQRDWKQIFGPISDPRTEWPVPEDIY